MHHFEQTKRHCFSHIQNVASRKKNCDSDPSKTVHLDGINFLEMPGDKNNYYIYSFAFSPKIYIKMDHTLNF